MFFFTEESADWPLDDLKVKYEVMITTAIKETYDNRTGKVRWISETEQGFAIREGSIWVVRPLNITRLSVIQALNEVYLYYCII